MVIIDEVLKLFSVRLAVNYPVRLYVADTAHFTDGIYFTTDQSQVRLDQIVEGSMVHIDARLTSNDRYDR